MATWIEKQLTNIADFASDLAETIYNDSQDQNKHYQSPLELNGLAMRHMMKNVRYYKKEYPYAICGDSGRLRTIDKYIAVSGWRPSTFDLDTTVINREFQNISSNFNIQN